MDFNFGLVTYKKLQIAGFLIYPKTLRATKEVSGNWRIINKYYKMYSSSKNYFKQMRLKICAEQMRILIKL